MYVTHASGAVLRIPVAALVETTHPALQPKLTRESVLELVRLFQEVA